MSLLPEKLTPHLAGLAARSPAVARQFLASAAEDAPDPTALADPIGDRAKSPLPGLIHRYPDRVLLLPTLACAAHCRFCFRRDRVGAGRMTAEEIEAALAYVTARPAIHEVVLSGGDPLTLPPADLTGLVGRIAALPRSPTLRIHTRLPVADPARVSAEVAPALARVSTPGALWIALHVNHPDELTPETRKAVRALQAVPAVLVSQTVLLAGVNDDPETLKALFRALVALGIKPYYLHQLDRARGTAHFRVPLARGRELVRILRAELSGLAQPAYVLDIPGGFGKVWAGAAFVEPAAGEDRWTVRDPDGNPHPYP